MMELGGSNNEPPVIRDVIKKYTQEEPSKLPTFIVFLSDGGVTDESGIKKAVIDAAKYSIFWQFVGLAGFKYGILERLDAVNGYIVDNADFFQLYDIEIQLYQQFISELSGVAYLVFLFLLSTILNYLYTNLVLRVLFPALF